MRANVYDRCTSFGLHHSSVLVFELWDSDRARGGHHRGSNWIWIWSGLNEDRSSRAPIFRIRCAVPILDPAIDVQDRVIVSSRVTGFRCEIIPITLVSACPNHHVDTRSAAQYSSHRQSHRTPIDVWTRCLVPVFDGAYFSDPQKEALWDKFYTGAPQRQRRSVERYNIVKRA